MTIIRRLPGEEEDSYGRLIPKLEEVEGLCDLQKQAHKASEEPGDEGELSDTLWDVFFAAGTDLRTGDAIRIAGVTYEMVGDPWSDDRPRVGHVEATVRRTAGSWEGS